MISKAWKNPAALFPRLGKLFAVFAVFSVTAAEPPPAAVATLPDAAQLLRQVVAGLPNEPLTIQARVEAYDDLDYLDKLRLAEMHLAWKDGAIQADYTIRDGFGANLARLELARPAEGAMTYKLFRGAQLAPEPLTMLDLPLEGTDINWLDLSLSYLWWPGGRTVGMEHVKGRACYVVDLPVPREVSTVCVMVRLWIEAKVHVLLQAEAYDAKQQRLRVLRIKSFKKVNDLWMLEDLEVQTYPRRHHTLLRVQELRRAGEVLQGDAEPPPAAVEQLPPTAPVTR
ncbi:MAG: outer membrane lipoprotein-sorting protein [Verrucomicrobia bacterium]|nr:MAG: outer membrane lipoprotein-sorting protein [Verrucomicrobiota bacterium]